MFGCFNNLFAVRHHIPNVILYSLENYIITTLFPEILIILCKLQILF